jgi:hypothetical protein
MPHRNEDGTFRNHHKVKTASGRTIRARWVEAEILRLKDEHMKTEAIAHHIILVGRGERQPMVPFPPGITFPPNFSFTHQAVSKAYNRAVDRIPVIEAQRLIKQTDRDLEHQLSCMAAGVRNGDPAAVNASTHIHELRLKAHGVSKGGTNIQVNTDVRTYPGEKPKGKKEILDVFQQAARIMRELDQDDAPPRPRPNQPHQKPLLTTTPDQTLIEATAGAAKESSPQLSNGKDESPPAKEEPEKPAESAEPKSIPWYAQRATYHVDPNSKERRASWD